MLCGALAAPCPLPALKGAGIPRAVVEPEPTPPPASGTSPEDEDPSLPGAVPPAPDTPAHPSAGDPRPLPAPAGLGMTEDTMFDSGGMAIANEPPPASWEAIPQWNEAQLENLANTPEEVAAVPSAGPDTRMSIVPAWHVGPVTVRLELRLGVLYDDNILLSQDHRQADWTYVLAAGFSLGLGNSVEQKGNFLMLEYLPQVELFQSHGQYDALDQHARLSGQYAGAWTTVQGALEYDHNSDPDRELGGRVSRDVLAADLGANYHESERLEYRLDGTLLVRNYEQGINSDEGRVRGWAWYELRPDLTVGLGVGGGALVPETGGTQGFEQVWVGATGRVSPTLSFDLRVGADLREPENEPGVMGTLLFDLTARYEPSKQTRFELAAVRQIFSSPDVVDQDYISTRLVAKATQRFWQIYKLELEGGYENADYVSVGAPGAGAREDNYTFGRVRASYAAFGDLDFGLYYLARRNWSNAAGLSFSDQQTGVDLKVGF